MTALRLSRFKVYGLIRSNELPSSKIGRARRVPGDSVRAYATDWRKLPDDQATPTAEGPSRSARTDVSKPPPTSTGPTGRGRGSSSTGRRAMTWPTSSRSCRRRHAKASPPRRRRWPLATI
ncbi:helix-turn-helix domain-containing protein [Streptomyces sp. NPDC048644]|uniref:helix-turn-helix domain-containing protein n=1 Tax=Streptomyces sp. NPDC048644 TaxID=3365582 RepID=UPI00371981F1